MTCKHPKKYVVDDVCVLCAGGPNSDFLRDEADRALGERIRRLVADNRLTVTLTPPMPNNPTFGVLASPIGGGWKCSVNFDEAVQKAAEGAGD